MTSFFNLLRHCVAGRRQQVHLSSTATHSCLSLSLSRWKMTHQTIRLGHLIISPFPPGSDNFTFPIYCSKHYCLYETPTTSHIKLDCRDDWITPTTHSAYMSKQTKLTFHNHLHQSTSGLDFLEILCVIYSFLPVYFYETSLTMRFECLKSLYLFLLRCLCLKSV